MAIPAYQDYIARSQMTEAVTLLGGAKTPLSEAVADKGSLPTALTDSVSTTSGKYVTTLVMGGNGTTIFLTATMAAAGVNNAIQGKTVQMFSTDGGRVWTCTRGDVDNKYLPAACR